MYHTLIIGAGFGGLCMAAKLKQAGQDNFRVLEKAGGVGGTWRENTYPGAECDIASALYSYSFWLNPTWEFKWAKQPQILSYLNDFTDHFKLRQHMQFGASVVSAVYDQAGFWEIELEGGERLKTRFLVSAIGQLHHPKVPEFKGLSVYQNPAFHSAQWDHSVDYAGKSVAVIGNAASAIQLIPEVAKTAGKLTVYHRSPNWMLPKGDRPYLGIEKWLARFIPGLSKLYRLSLFCQGEYAVWPMIKGKQLQSAFGEWWCKSAIKKYIKDPAVRAKLTPDYPIGAKRILLSDKIYPAYARDNVELVFDGVDHFTKDGITAKDGTQRDHDLTVIATGFYSNPFLKEISVKGAQGQSLSDVWADGAHAYMGTMTAGFPNLFILYGPNTNSGHMSIVYKLEAQVKYALQLMAKAGEGTVDVDEAAEADFNAEMQARLKQLAWNKVEESWYKQGARITNNWPGSALEFKRRFAQPDWAHFHIQAGEAA